jgi:Uma2 family endonuclease
MMLTQAKHWTYQDYLELDDENRYEIISGELLMAPAPTFKHQYISANIEKLINFHLQNNDLGILIHAPLDIIFSDKYILQPDIIFIANENLSIIVEHGIEGVPDMIIEIISPSTMWRDRHEKMTTYESFGVNEYWIVDPENQTIDQYLLNEGVYSIHNFFEHDQTIKSQVINGLELGLESVFQLPRKYSK